MLALLSFCGTSNDAWGQEEVVEKDTTVFVVSFEGKFYAMINHVDSIGEKGESMQSREVDIAGDKVINYYGDSIEWEINYVNKGKGRDSAYIKTIGETEPQYYLHGASTGATLNLQTTPNSNLWVLKDTLDLDSMWINAESIEKEPRSFYTKQEENGNKILFKGYKLEDLKSEGGAGHHHSEGSSVSVKWVDAEDAYVRDSLQPASYGTICLPRSVAATDYSGVTFYSIAGKNETADSLYLTEVESLEKGTPYIFFTNDTTILAVAYHGTSVTTPVDTNGLIGNLDNDSLDVDSGMYMIDDNQVRECGTDCKLAKNRAYIDMSKVPEYDPKSQINAKVRVISIGGSIGGTTHVAAVTADSDKVDVYTIGGVMVRRKAEAATATAGLQKGIYIVNHKKVAVK